MVCFFNFAYTSLLKSRNSEFGLLMGLGITVKELRRIVFVENTGIVLLASFFGLLSGTIFSRLFFLGVIKVLKAYYIHYSIGIDNYLMTAGIFLTAYICIISIKNRRFKKLDVISLMASEQEGERLNLYQPALGLLGIGLILASFALVYLAAVGVLDDPEKSSHFTILCFTGLYLAIAQLGNLYLETSKRFKRYYLKNLLSITELNHKLSRNKDMMYILTLLVSLTLFFLGFAY
jgi:ABC-type antimicrobial peptide transport system permease subunit